MAGNYGGNSIPTTPIGAETLWNGKDTTYVNYKCSAIFASAATSNFTYKGVVYTLGAIGAKLDLVIEPRHISALPVGVYFLCYDCSCSTHMTGTTAPSVQTYQGAPMYAPTIIGGEGLNS